MLGRVAMSGALAMAVAGCATKAMQLQSRDDWLREVSHTYADEPPERVIRAAEIVLKHSDPDDFEFQHHPEGFVGRRKWLVYAVIAAANGVDVWDFRAGQAEGGGTIAIVNISESAAGTAATVVPTRRGALVGTVSSESADQAAKFIGVYRLFWARVDYVLGRRPDWILCGHVKALIDPELSVSNNKLCDTLTSGDSNPPPEPLPKAVLAPPKAVDPGALAPRVPLSPRTSTTVQPVGRIVVAPKR